jgi:hypothetical protein
LVASGKDGDVQKHAVILFSCISTEYSFAEKTATISEKAETGQVRISIRKGTASPG